MTAKMPAWSYSSLTSFETCAKRYYHLRVAKDVVEPPNDATTWGSEVHKHLENRVKDDAPLPDAIGGYEPLVAKIVDTPGEKIVEKQFAVNSALKPTGWFAPDTWCRGIVDVGVLTSKTAVLLDWKTGKRKPDSDQLTLFAGMAFAHYPEINVVSTGFVWLKEGKLDVRRFERKDAIGIWQSFAPRVARMKRAYEEDSFPPKPSGLCGRWCPVPKSKCTFSGKP